jgi:hypothetical protein
MKKLFALVFAGGSAYSFSFALDLLIGGVLKVYSSNVFVAVVTWSIIATVCGVIALKLAPSFRLLPLPFVGLAIVALFGGVIGHRHSLLVGAIMVVQSAIVYCATARSARFDRSRAKPQAGTGTLQSAVPGRPPERK